MIFKYPFSINNCLSMHILSVMNHKGGVGKTTTTLNVAAALHEADQRVLLLDLDSQCSASLAMGLPRQNISSGPSTADLLFKKRSISNSCYHNTWPGIDLVPASIDLAHAGLQLDPGGNDSWRLDAILDTSEVTDRYDTVLIDCPPAISIVTVNALLASTDLLIPTVPSPMSLEGLKSIGEVISRMRSDYENTLALAGIALTRVDHSRSEVKDTVREIRDHYHRNVFDTAIPETNTIEQAQKRHRSILDYAPESTAAQRYRFLTGEITQRWTNYDAVLGDIRTPKVSRTVSATLSH